MVDQNEISKAAKLAARNNIAENPTFDVEGIATLTYLDGYMAGHKAAMQEAQRITDEVLQ